MKIALSIFLVFALCITQAACTQFEIINDLEIAAEAASAARSRPELRKPFSLSSRRSIPTTDRILVA